MPFFSIIIPVYNKEAHVEKTLLSVLKQQFKDFEIIIINDGSTDNSIQIIESLTINNSTIINQPNKGVSASRNIGIENSNGKFIAFLDADDYWYPNHLTELHNAIINFPNEAIFCGNYEQEFKNGVIKASRFSIPIIKNQQLITNYFEASLLSTIASTPSLAIRKELLKSPLIFDQKIRSGEDTDLWIRLALKYNFVICRKVTVRHLKFVANSLSKENFTDDKYDFIRKNEIHEKENPSLKKYLDLNRFAVALEYKLNAELKKFKIVSKQIDLKNLPLKRKILLFTPLWMLQILKKAQKFK